MPALLGYLRCRLGYVVFYNPTAYLAAPLDILMQEGSMSFHGGLAGVIRYPYCARRYRLKAMAIGDEVALVAPLGLFFGSWPILSMVNCMGG